MSDSHLLSKNNILPKDYQKPLVSGTDIKTVNSNSLLGSGNISLQEPIIGAASSVLSSNLTESRAVISNANGKLDVSSTTSTELGYVHGVTSDIQIQLNGKANVDLSNLSAAGQAKFDAKADKNIPVIGIPATSGAVTLADNTVYSGTMAGEMTFVLPTVTDATQYHQIKAMLYLPVVTINWGTTHYIGGEAPDVSEAGQYMIYWDYVPALSAWAVGAMKVV